MIEIRRANRNDIAAIVPLFDAYRVFYEQQSDEKAAKHFLEERLTKSESIVFLAYENQKALGFLQLYPSFSSVSMQAIYILNDLFVISDQRKKGIGKALLVMAQQYCKEKNGKGLALETAVDNPAQFLYESLQWKKDSHCFHYFWSAV